jgi:threonine/homoserine/homoserine lactone efflux protein
MDLDLLVRGVIIGLAIAAPVGPIGVLCMRRTLAEGRLVGFVSGLGAATADAVYGCIAGFGLTVVANLLLDYNLWIRLVGSVFLCYLGITALRSTPPEQPASLGGSGLLAAYATTFALTITNPMTILAFAAIFAGLGIVQTATSYTAALTLVAGVFSGSALWWLLLSSVVSIARSRLNTRSLTWVNRAAGMVMLGFGLWYGLAVLIG